MVRRMRQLTVTRFFALFAASAAFVVAGLVSVASAAEPGVDEALKAAVASEKRTPAFVQRDGARHPYETLMFFGIKPDMTVVELSPGGGWYTEILAPYL